MIKRLKALIIFFIILFLPVNATANVATNISSDPTSDLIKRLLVQVNVDITRINTLTYQIRKAEVDYKISPILLIALIEEELKFSGFAQARAFTYNIDNGIIIAYEKVESLPCPYSDIDRVARSLANQLETFNNDLETSVAAYFFGTPMMKRHTVEDLSDEGKEIIQNIASFIRNNPDDRSNSTPIFSSTEPRIAQSSQQGSRQGSRRDDDVFSMDAKRKFASIEEKYIAVMRHFNRSLDQKTASEIYWAIATLHSRYPNVDARLVMALFAVESSFRPDAVSHKGAQGLGQLMPFTAESLNVDDPFNCTENVRGTFLYLDREIERWKNHNNSLDLVLAAYNAGPNAVKRHGNDIPPFKETQAYVKKVINIYSQLLLQDEFDEKLRGKTRYYSQIRR